MIRATLVRALARLLRGPPRLGAGLAALERGDHGRARRILLQLAEAGDGEAAYRLGLMAEGGLGGPPDEGAALAWFRRAAERNHAAACRRLGALYEAGALVPQDDREAVRWYRAAAGRHDADAAYRLALKLAAGEGVPADRPRALALLESALPRLPEGLQAEAEARRASLAAGLSEPERAAAGRLARSEAAAEAARPPGGPPGG